tara:strand:- start:80 stop:361 length:282 start_codon:yes stop_codon:yes gene_type:complete
MYFTLLVTEIEIPLEFSKEKAIMSSPLPFAVIAYAILMATKTKVLLPKVVLPKVFPKVFPKVLKRHHQQQHKNKRKTRAYQGIFEHRDTPLHH